MKMRMIGSEGARISEWRAGRRMWQEINGAMDAGRIGVLVSLKGKEPAPPLMLKKTGT